MTDLVCHWCFKGVESHLSWRLNRQIVDTSFGPNTYMPIGLETVREQFIFCSDEHLKEYLKECRRHYG